MTEDTSPNGDGNKPPRPGGRKLRKNGAPAVAGGTITVEAPPVPAKLVGFRPEMVEQVERLCEIGATNPEIARFFGVTVHTLDNWRVASPEFAEALRIGRETADARVERSLYQRAVGYEQTVVKVFLPAGSREPVFARYVEQMPPDVGASIFWLKNRRREDWKDRIDSDHTGDVKLVVSRDDDRL